MKYFRRPHVLRHNNMNMLPERFVFFDTETKPIPRGDEQELRLVLGTAVFYRRSGGQTAITFYTPQTFWKFVNDACPNKTALYLVAHNIGFDFRVLGGFDALKRRGFTLEKIIFNGTSNVWKFVQGSRTIYALDNMNFFNVPLAHLGKSIGIPKLEMPKYTDREALASYCMNDTQVVVQSWIRLLDFLDENNLGNFAKTIAGQAFNAFRHRFMHEKIYIHDRVKAIALERDSYRGGRTECFRIGEMPKEEYTMFDVNSMYPSLMQALSYPVKLLGEIKTFKHLKTVLDSGEGAIARVIVSTNKPVFGVRVNKKLMFPVGTFEATLTTRELNYALDNGMIEKKLVTGYRYKMKPIFTDYVDFFYRKKREYIEMNNPAFAYMCKIFLNSLYGKFGQRNEIYETVGFDGKAEDGAFEFYDTDEGVLKKRRVIGGTVQESIGYREGYESFCAIAAHVTADARMKLWELFEKAGRKNVFYCDTDSAIVNRKGATRLMPLVGKELGQLSIKGTTEHLVLWGNKDYEFGDDITMKGVKKNAVNLGGGLFEQDQFEGIAGAIRKGRLNKMMIRRATKQLKREYDKGVVLPSGVVVPYRLGLQGSLTI